MVAAYPERADPRDVLVSMLAGDLDSLPSGAVLLTGALRRRAQILLRRPDCASSRCAATSTPRIRKWREQGAGGVILAGAGLARLGLTGLPVHPIPADVLLPAPGQGILALEVREGSPAAEACRVLNHAPSARAAEAERRVVAAFGGDCTLPLAAWARPENETLRLTALLATPTAATTRRGEATGDDSRQIAEDCVAAMRANGADAVLARIRG